jgi:hypothetical protein
MTATAANRGEHPRGTALRERGRMPSASGPITAPEVLAALAAHGLQLTRLDPVSAQSRCPACAGSLILREVDWGDGRRRVILWCPRDDEGTILKALGLRPRSLFVGIEPLARLSDGLATRRVVTALIDRLAQALGNPVATPERLTAAGGKLERARYRVWRWPCPVCLAGGDDPIYRPLVVDSDGRVWCEAAGCTTDALSRAVRARLCSTNEPELAA